ncbi:MAG: diguanylate cyclase, partial [candidate division Zixibacteria bacterium]|nr:diguanylate cyclase [candidate division Zixibacteria bacterium]
MGKVREASGISEMVYLYEPGTETEQPQLLTNGLSRPVTVPDRKVFEDIIKAVESRRRPKSGELAADSDLAADWIRELQQTGLKNTSSFPLTSSRRGVLAWTSELPAETVEKNLNTLRTHAADLVENAESFERVEEMSYTDNLTGLANRRYFFRRLEEEVSRARRYNRQVALIIFDLDG